MITYAQLLVAFRSDPGESETVGRWVRKFEETVPVRFGDWFPLGFKIDADEFERLVTFVSTDVVAGSQWVVLDPVRPAHGHQLRIGEFFNALWKVGWIEVERIPVEGSVIRL